MTVLERTNARYLTAEMIGGLVPELTVMDVSFISVKLILANGCEVDAKQGIFCILIKPQFEAGPGKGWQTRRGSRRRNTRISVIRRCSRFCRANRIFVMSKLDLFARKRTGGQH